MREQLGVSRRELAARARLSERFLAQVESGEGNPSVVSLLQIAGALKTTGAALLEGPARREAVVLLGIRGAGKSTVGRALAGALGVPWIELDQKIEESAGLALQEIFVLHGEDYYRDLEREALSRLVPAASRVVIAASGGIVTNRATFDMLKQNAVTVWLRAAPEDHWNRVVAQGDHRPMGNDPLAMERLRELLKQRENLYAEADLAVDTSAHPVGDVVKQIVQFLEG
jgi:XRE family aerobic/anaerobic benzoate catabolism transcriptional regulator